MTCKLEIVEGRALLPMDLNGKSDPYVVIFFGGFNIQQKRTSTRYTTLKPMWNETFYFVGGEDGMDTIRLEVWDEDTMTRDDYMGEVAFTACVSTLSDPSGDVEQGPMHEGGSTSRGATRTGSSRLASSGRFESGGCTPAR